MTVGWTAGWRGGINKVSTNYYNTYVRMYICTYVRMYVHACFIISRARIISHAARCMQVSDAR